MIRLQKKYWGSTIGLSLFAILVIYALINEWCIEKNIEDNKYITITKVYEAVERRSISRLYYHYYYEDTLISSVEKKDDYILKKLVGRYYKVYLSTENPLYSRIQLDKEVTDTVAIKAAGFKIEKEKPKKPKVKRNQFQEDNTLK